MRPKRWSKKSLKLGKWGKIGQEGVVPRVFLDPESCRGLCPNSCSSFFSANRPSFLARSSGLAFKGISASAFDFFFFLHSLFLTYLLYFFASKPPSNAKCWKWVDGNPCFSTSLPHTTSYSNLHLRTLFFWPKWRTKKKEKNRCERRSYSCKGLASKIDFGT